MTTPQAVRLLNETRALDILFREGAMSRAELARALNLTRSTTGSLVATLLDEGFVVEEPQPAKPETARTGRPGIAVGLRPDGAVFLGAEIGVGYINLVALNFRIEVIGRRQLGFEVAGNRPEDVVALACGAVRSLIAELGGRARIRGLCVTVPGLHDHDGVLLTGPFLGWRHVRVTELVRAELDQDLHVISENDANAFAIAETYGLATAPQDLLCLFIDYGVGAGIVSQGRLYRGHRGYAGEVGHMVVADAGVVHRLDPPGRWENLIGADALLHKWRAKGGQGDEIVGLVRAVEAGELAACRTAEHWAYWLGRGLGTLANVLDPGHVVLGGSVAALFPAMRDAVERSLRQHVFQDYPVPGITLARHQHDGPAIGAACILHQDMLSLDDKILRRGRWNESDSRIFMNGG